MKPPLRLLSCLAALACAVSLATPTSAQVEASRNMTLLAHKNDYPYYGSGKGYSACWSYVHGDGREFAVIGHYDGTAIYEVTNPAQTTLVAWIPGAPSVWRETTSYRNWIYIVTEGFGTGKGLQIVRMTDPSHPVLVRSWLGSFETSHTVSVDTSRALLVCNGTRNALHEQTGMVILSIADPENPVELSAWPGGILTGVDPLYAHDSHFRGTRLFVSCVYSGQIHVLDTTNPAAPVELSAWTYPGGFTHNTWTDQTGHWLYATDEARREPLKVFDISNLNDPRLVNRVTSNREAVVHNAFVKGDELFLANFTEGTRVLDISDPAHPAEFAWADTWPGSTPGFGSIWNVCPFFPSGIVIASDRQTGLYVYRPVRNYGLVRVEVALTGPPPATPQRDRRTLTPEISMADVPPVPAAETGGVDVQLVNQGDLLLAPADGVVRFAPSPGPQTVRVSAFGYRDAEATVQVTAGETDTVFLTLVQKPGGSLGGVVRDAVTQVPLDEAEIAFEDTPLHTRTDTTGVYAYPIVPEDVYAVEVHRPGYAPISRPLVVNVLTPPTLEFGLVPAATWDDLDTDRGWVVGAPGDNAVRGIWTRVEPLGTGTPPGSGNGLRAPGVEAHPPPIAPEHGDSEEGLYPGEIQPEYDRTPGAGTMCFVTGQGTDPIDVWENNVDGGHTSLTSPPFDLTSIPDPALGYWHWLYTDGDDNDWLAVSISGNGGATWTPVDTLRGLHNHWHEETVRVADYVTPGSDVRLRFVANDGGGVNIVEAAIDDVIAYHWTGPVAVEPAPIGARLALSAPRPNPSRGDVTFVVSAPTPGRLEAEVLDVGGRRVRRLDSGVVGAGTTALRWDGMEGSGKPAAPGVYVLRARLGSTEVSRRFARIR